MKCPNCGFNGADELFGSPPQCPECDAYYAKALRVKALKKEQRKKKAQSSAPSEKPAKKDSLTLFQRFKGKHASNPSDNQEQRPDPSGHRTLYTPEGAPVLIRVESNKGGCLKPIMIVFALSLLYSLASTSCTSYNGYVERSKNPELALQYSQKQAKKRKAADDDMRRVKIERMARDGIKPKLYDPDTAKFRSQRGGCGEVNAKNLFGAYTGYKRFLYGGPDLIIIEDSPELAEGAFEEAWILFCGEGGKLAF